MKLSDIMAGMGLAVFAEVALVIFLGVFAGVAVYVFRGGKSLENLRFLPLDETAPELPPKAIEE